MESADRSINSLEPHSNIASAVKRGEITRRHGFLLTCVAAVNEAIQTCLDSGEIEYSVNGNRTLLREHLKVIKSAMLNSDLEALQVYAEEDKKENRLPYSNLAAIFLLTMNSDFF